MKIASPSATRYLALHGFTGSGSDFSVLSRFLGGHWECPDLPGHGNRANAPEEEFSLRSLPSGFPGDTDPPVVGIGYSMGARLLLHLALREPNRFSKLVLIGGSPGIAAEEERKARVEADAKWIALLKEKGMEAFLREWHRQPVLQTARPKDPAVLREFMDRRQRNDPEGLARSLKLHGTGALPSLWHRLPELKIPTLLCVGSNDAKFNRIAELMSKVLPTCLLVTINGSGHAPHWENPTETARAINGFVAERQGTGRQ